MSLRVVFFSDSHLGFDEPIRPRLDKPRRGADFFANVQRVLDFARSKQVDLVVHGGDVFFRSKVHASIVDRAYQMLFEFAECGIPIAIVPGNHERSVLPPSLFLHHPNIFVFDRPRTYLFEARQGTVALSGFAYQPDVRRHFCAAVAASDPQTADFRMLCFHHAVEGAVVGPGGFTFRRGSDVIRLEDLPQKFDILLSGHIHRHQLLRCSTPVLYSGSIERTSFAERDETKGFCELNFQAPGVAPQISFHPLPTRPMIDFEARHFARPASVIDAVAADAVRWSADAIVRVRLNSYPDKKLLQALRQHVPGILNVSVSG